MERKSKIFIVSWLLVIVAIALIVTLNLDFFQEIIEKNINVYGYPAVFVFSFFVDLFDQPIGPEIPSSFAFIFGLDILVVFFLSVAGSWIASLTIFFLGKNILSEKIKTSCSKGEHINHCRLFMKYGEIALFLAATTPIPYVIFIWLSGAFQMKLRNFFVFGLLARAFRIGIILLIVAGIIQL